MIQNFYPHSPVFTLMQKITVVGKDSAAKNAVIIALKSNFKVINLLPEQVDIKNVNSINLVLHLNEDPDQQDQDSERLNNLCSLSLQLQSQIHKLNDIQRNVFLQLPKRLSDQGRWTSLHLSRSRYFSILEQLRGLFDVESNCQLTQLAKLAQDTVPAQTSYGKY
jgi:hypothetical protein